MLKGFRKAKQDPIFLRTEMEAVSPLSKDSIAPLAGTQCSTPSPVPSSCAQRVCCQRDVSPQRRGHTQALGRQFAG